MGKETCAAATSAFAEALHRYLTANARRTVSIAEVTGQATVRVSVRVLFRGHNPLYGFPRAVDALSYLISRGFGEWVGRRWGWSFEEIDRGYLIIPLDWLRGYLSKGLDDLVLEVREFCAEELGTRGKEKNGLSA